jgi:hypothetical protein
MMQTAAPNSPKKSLAVDKPKGVDAGKRGAVKLTLSRE